MKNNVKINLSAYTIVTNCTDITDCTDGIVELWKACGYYEDFGKKVPKYVYKRIERLQNKRDKFSLKKYRMTYIEYLKSLPIDEANKTLSYNNKDMWVKLHNATANLYILKQGNIEEVPVAGWWK